MGRSLASRMRLPRGLLGMLALVAGVELGLSRLQGWVLPTSHWSWTRDGQAATSREARTSRVLLFGDSMIKNGLLPRLLEERSGQSAFNLALLGGHTPASYFLLKRALDAGAKPAAVVVDYERARLELNPNDPENKYPWASLLNPAEAADLAWTCRDPQLAGRLLLGEVFPSVRMRQDLRTAIRVNVQGLSVMARWGQLVYRRNMRQNRGSLVHQPTPGIANIPLRPDAAQAFAQFRPRPASLSYVERFVALATGRGIPVVWVLPPISPGLQANFDAGPGEEAMVDYARDLQRRFPLLTLVDGRRSGYPVDVFADPVHLDRRGAAAFTEGLASLLGPDGTPPRGSVMLPPFPGVRDRPDVEDIEQSNAILAAAGAGVRR